MNTILYKKHSEINKVQWDNCVRNSGCNLIYMQSFYLDAMAPEWEAIVINNYEAVFAITYRKKYGIKYIYHPAFIQQLGLCSTNKHFDFETILPTIKKYFKYADIFLNHTNKKISYSDERTNYVLKLNNEYKYYYNNYKKDLKRNIKKSNKENLIYKNNDTINLAIHTYKAEYFERIKNITSIDYEKFEKLCLWLENKNKVLIRSVYNFNNELLSIALLLVHENRLYNMMNSTTEKGKSVSANHFLMDKIINEFCESDYTLDFEGSDLPGVREFYLNFSPVYEPYYYFKINNLNPILKLLKT